MNDELEKVIEEMGQNLERSIFAGWTDHATVQSWRQRLVQIQQDLADPTDDPAAQTEKADQIR